jgi:hypothetical protein
MRRKITFGPSPWRIMDAYSVVRYAVAIIFWDEPSAKLHILSKIYEENTFEVTKKFNQRSKMFLNHSVVELKSFLEREVSKKPSFFSFRVMTDLSIRSKLKKYEISFGLSLDSSLFFSNILTKKLNYLFLSDFACVCCFKVDLWPAFCATSSDQEVWP